MEVPKMLTLPKFLTGGEQPPAVPQTVVTTTSGGSGFNPEVTGYSRTGNQQPQIVEDQKLKEGDTG